MKKSGSKIKKKRITRECLNCKKNLVHEDRVLFVEEEVGRIFCTEDCISKYFVKDIEKIEKIYEKNVESTKAFDDFTKIEQESLSHLRWLTLDHPEEIWLNKNKSGDHVYTLIAEYNPHHRKLWCICICLMLKGEPSFMFIAFPTCFEALVDEYRVGERVEAKNLKPTNKQGSEWTEEETWQARFARSRKKNDIPGEEFEMYQDCFEETLNAPNEVWAIEYKSEEKLYHFIKHYKDGREFWYVIIAKDTDEEDQLEILDAFPTKDSEFMASFRTGSQEYTHTAEDAAAPMQRTLH